MRAAHTVEQVRTAEAALMATLPEGALMQRAAAGLATVCADLLGRVYGARVAVLVGSGDNGGDALFAAARLARRGARVEAVLLKPEKTHAGGLAAFRAAGGRVVSEPGPADLLLDGIVGIGGKPGLRDQAADLVKSAAAGVVVAVDVPSGLDVDTGETPAPHMHADVTVTFGTHKVGLLVDPGAAAAGSVHLVDIGLDLPAAPVEALQETDAAALLPVPDRDAHKYTRGVVGVAAGSTEFTGAAVLAVAGAVGGPCGMVRYDGPDSVAALVRSEHPEVVVGPGRVQSWVVGSGGGGDVASTLGRVCEDGVPLVVDADALGVLDAPLGVPGLLTPHAGELARMLEVAREEVEAAPLRHAREAAARFDATVLLKGRRTLVAAPDGRVRVNVTGNAWLATAGAGDVLAGLCGSLLAAGLDPLDAGSLGAWLHGAAATLSGVGGPVTASAVAAALPLAAAGLLEGHRP
ncbi:MAG: NAD(P)H-hydrate dehydratase [Actinomycetota bacterium]|nr:NAD(P)H-hydrate dehydratase [Actinomycetota bacterium]